MQIEFSYEKEFDELFERLRENYPDELFELDGLGSNLDLNKFRNQFFDSDVTADGSIDPNANVSDVSVISYSVESKKPMHRLDSYYRLWKTLKEEFSLDEANEIIERNIIGDIYINDMHGISAGKSYCFNFSTYDVMTKGLPMVNKIESKPPKHLLSFMKQLEQFMVLAANSTLGATGISDILLVMSLYIDNILKDKEESHFKFATDGDVWKYVREQLTSTIYTLNQPLRSNQSIFSNISIYDQHFLENMINDYIHPQTGATPEIETVQKLQEMFIDIMNEELQRTPVTFPVTTACFSVDENNNLKDKDFLEMISKKNLPNGFINIYMGETSTLSSCCRLRSDTSNEYFNSFGTGSSKIGSLGVVTINLPRIALKYDSKEEIFKQLRHLVGVSNKVNYAKRKIIEDVIDKGKHPLYTLGFMDIDKQYHTVGVNGFNEMIELMGEDILEEDGIQLGKDIIKTINNENDKYGQDFGVPVNCEQIPAEGTSVKLVKKDRMIGHLDDSYDYKLYSNQFIPLTTGADLLDRIKLQGTFDENFSGGSIGHWNVDTKLKDWEQMANLIESSANMGVVYFAINYMLGKCENGHMSVTTGEICPICGSPITDHYTRVVGFLVNTKHFNKTRREHDTPNRKFYPSISEAI
jgi:ribonucleoside-triphosphate reductase